eukprot:TRINITY_DN2268_c0_g2_i1.p1 TRINITY_DN2268_c0_g2~~TRINITY_DN2268_c0_g2_i1.p1  ORF type:complete len:51 (+),score=2.89 TRINITY_DN2268_c0_g2_i1:245-397(+)
MMTVSAVCKLRPRPPACVERINKKYGESGRFHSFTNVALSSGFVCPSKRN